MSRNSDRNKLKNNTTTKTTTSGSQSALKDAAKNNTKTTTPTTSSKNTANKTTTPTTSSKTTTNKTTTPTTSNKNTTNKTTADKTTGGTSLPSLSKNQQEAWNDFAKSGSTTTADKTSTPATSDKTAGGTSLPSLSKNQQEAWNDFAKNGNKTSTPGPAPGLGTKTETTGSSGNNTTTGTTGNKTTGTSGQTTTGGSASGYDNGGLTAEQIKAMQRFYGTDADGLWGANSTAAAGGKTAAEAWNAYQTALREQQQQQQEQEQEQQQQQGQQTGSNTPNDETTLPSTPAGDTRKLTADVSGMRDLLDQWLSAAKQQQEAAINYGVEQGVNELRRAEEDAQQQYQAQQDQINIDEARAKDNQALYAEARGDRGGIGAAQYDSIMNAAAQNRLTVSQQQTKLSTDTARQIADLRAQGEYEKADTVLQLTQQYLTQLMSLEQWALEYQMDVEQFNLQLEKWQAEYALSLAKLNGTSSGSSGGTSSGGTSSGSSGGTSSDGTSSGGTSSGVDPSSMTSAEIKEWQRRLGVTADGIWGPNTQAAYDAIYGRGGSSTQFTGTKPNTDRTSLDYSPDEGIFTYAGKTYSTIAGVINAINNANLSDAEFAQVKAKLEAATGVKWQ